MSIQYEDTLLDFDLDFLHQTTTKTPEKSTEKSGRCRKSVSLAKRKIIATDSLIRKYYEKKEEVEQIERTLTESKEEYKQTCIEFKNMVDRFTIKEQEAQSLRKSNVELQEKYEHAQNTVGAMQSHANQLQNLVKQNETTIESLTIENQMYKANAKDYEKKYLSLQKENEDLMRHICLVRDVVFGKKKLNKRRKEILLKYKKNYESDDNDSLLGDQTSEHDTDTENDSNPLHSPNVATLLPKNAPKKDSLKGEYASHKDDNGHDSDCSNELASADTGRGSSLAFSDGEKCFNSPDYFNAHSPINPDAGSHSKNLVTTATSPINFAVKIRDGALSPPVFQYENIQITLSPVSTQDVDNINATVSPMQVDNPDIEDIKPNETLSNAATKTTPFPFIAPVISDNHSDICIDEETTCSSPVIITGADLSTDSQLNNTTTLSERDTLELNNSNNLDDNSTGDCEIEMILQRMRLHHTLLTPIPSSPSKSSRCSMVSKTTEEVDNNVSKDVEKIREENKILNQKLSELEQEIVNIKDILKDKRLLDQQPYKDTVDGDLNNSDLLPCLENTRSIVSKHVSSNSEVYETVVSGAQSKTDSSNNSKKSINANDFNQLKKDVLQKSHENHEHHAESNNDKTTGHSTNFTTSEYVSNGAKDKTKINDKLEFEDPQPLSPINDKLAFEDADPISRVTGIRNEINAISCNFTQSAELNISTSHLNISGDIDEDSLPLSSILQFDKEPIYEGNTLSQDKQIDNVQPKNAPKNRKLTKLEKMRNKLLPKSKIKNISSVPKKKLRSKPKQLPLLPKQLSRTDDAASLNDKDVYEKALRVMSELKSKEQSKSNEKSCKNKLRGKGLVNPGTIRNKESLVKASNINNVNSSCIDKTSQDDRQVSIKNVDGVKERKIRNVKKSTSPCSYKEANQEDVLSVIKNVESKEVVGDDEREKELLVAVVKCDENLNVSQSPPKNTITTRSRSKFGEELNISPVKRIITDRESALEIKLNGKHNVDDTEVNTEVVKQGSRKRPKPVSNDKPDVQCKRMLRSSTLRQSNSEENCSPNSDIVSNAKIVSINDSNSQISTEGGDKITTILKASKEVLSYNDMEMFTSKKDDSPSKQSDEVKVKQVRPRDSIFCAMVDKFGKHSTKNFSKKLPDSVIASTTKLLQEEIPAISELPPNDTKSAMNKLVDTISNWGSKQFMAGLMAYLQDPQRKMELFNKICSPPAPPMTKAEQILLYVIAQLRQRWSSVDVVDCTLCNIEYMLFKLNRTPEFDTIESTSHFYAVLCRYFKLKSRLRLFMLDAMYCIQFKAVPLIKQCIEVWMHVLPLAHMGIAKSPLVTCMVYLLHFYKCEDRFNRVQDIRNILSRKYFFVITNWNEQKIIEMFKNAIHDVKAVSMERKLLRIALIVIAKRNGPRWCQNNIIKKLLLPIIESDANERVKIFCVSILGPLLKPYPVDMKVHCEIVMNKLLDILKQNPSHSMEEAIFTSLIYMRKHNYTRVIQSLLSWSPQRISPELETLMRDLVREKPLKAWKTMLSKIQIV